MVICQHLAGRRQHHAGAGRLLALVGKVGLDHNHAGADRCRSVVREGEAGSGDGGSQDGDQYRQDDTGIEAPGRVAAQLRRDVVKLHWLSSGG